MNKDIFLPTTSIGIAASLLSSRAVSDGEPVDAATTNRLPRTNSFNTAYLHELLKQLRNTAGEFLWNVPVADDVVPGDFVYYDGTDRVFSKAVAKYHLAGDTFVETESASVWGVVIRAGRNEGDLCTSGLCEFRTEIGTYWESPEPGMRYLSDRTPGEPTANRFWPDKCLGYLVGVKSDGRVQFFVRPQMQFDPRIHRHKSFELANVPAGTCRADQPQTIGSIRPDKPGWIPVDHTLFAGSAPSGAVYGYNPAFLQNVCEWPLRFAAGAKLRWQRHGSESDDPLLADVPPELYLITETTIWWMTDLPACLPWHIRTDYVDGEASEKPDTPYGQRIWLDYIDSGYGLADAIVTSLRTVAGSGLKLTRYPLGGTAITGDLLLDFELLFRQIADGDLAGLAVKKIEKNELTLGPVVSGLKIDSSRWRIVQSQRTKDGFHYGSVVLGDPSGKIGHELPFEAVHLEGVEEAVEREAIGLAFTATRTSSFLARIAVPFDTDFDRFDLSLSFGILVTRSGNVAPGILKLSCRVIENPSAVNKISQAFPQNTLERIPCDFSVQNNQYSNGYYTAESGKIRVKPGDLLLLKVERTPPDNFSDRIILLRKSALLHYV